MWKSGASAPRKAFLIGAGFSPGGPSFYALQMKKLFQHKEKSRADENQ
jgi:hypothetical protein